MKRTQTPAMAISVRRSRGWVRSRRRMAARRGILKRVGMMGVRMMPQTGSGERQQRRPHPLRPLLSDQGHLHPLVHTIERLVGPAQAHVFGAVVARGLG